MSPSLSLLIARIGLVAVFPVSAAYKIMEWPGIENVVTKAGLPYARELAIAGTAAELVLPLLVIAGMFTRLSAIGLIVYTIVATAIAHRFWEFSGQQQFMQLMSFLKNIGLIGGLVVIASIGSGRYALWPSQKSSS
jgi:putative oxidoreductase